MQEALANLGEGVGQQSDVNVQSTDTAQVSTSQRLAWGMQSPLDNGACQEDSGATLLKYLFL